MADARWKTLSMVDTLPCAGVPADLDVVADFGREVLTVDVAPGEEDPAWLDVPERPLGPKREIVHVTFSLRRASQLREGWRRYHRACPTAARWALLVHGFFSAPRTPEGRGAARGVAARALGRLFRWVADLMPAADCVVLLEADGSLRDARQTADALRALEREPEERLERALRVRRLVRPRMDPAEYRRELAAWVEHKQANEELVAWYARRFALRPLFPGRKDGGARGLEVPLWAPLDEVVARVRAWDKDD